MSNRRLPALVGFVLGGAGTPVAATTAPPGDVRPPPVGAVFDSQLGGAYPPDAGVEVVIRDRDDPPEPGAYNVCYVNAFQTQPDEAEIWADHPLLVLHDGDDPVIDPEWPDEAILAPIGPRRQRALLAIVGPWLDQCAADGFDAVELDNLDTFTRFPNRIPVAEAVRYAALLVDRAHAAGLAVAQKNTVELLDRRAETGFDFVVSEECGAYDECGEYAAAFPGLVFDIEYDDEGFEAACATATPVAVIRRDRDLTPAGDPDHVRAECPG